MFVPYRPLFYIEKRTLAFKQISRNYFQKPFSETESFQKLSENFPQIQQKYFQKLVSEIYFRKSFRNIPRNTLTYFSRNHFKKPEIHSEIYFQKLSPEIISRNIFRNYLQKLFSEFFQNLFSEIIFRNFSQESFSEIIFRNIFRTSQESFPEIISRNFRNFSEIFSEIIFRNIFRTSQEFPEIIQKLQEYFQKSFQKSFSEIPPVSETTSKNLFPEIFRTEISRNYLQKLFSETYFQDLGPDPQKLSEIFRFQIPTSPQKKKTPMGNFFVDRHRVTPLKNQDE
jgi:hypothetical protein